MDFIKLILSPAGHYQYKEASSIAMNILGNFLASDVGCGARLSIRPTLQEWALNDSLGTGFAGNITSVDKEDDFIFISDLFADEHDSTRLKMSRQQFIRLIDDWQKEVCMQMPKEIIIKHEDNHFIIETN